MTIDFKMWRYLGLVFVSLSVVNILLGWLLGNPIHDTLLIELAYFGALVAAGSMVDIWLRKRVNEAWDKALVEALEPLLELRMGDFYGSRISEDAFNGPGTSSSAVFDQTKDPHPPTKAPPREARQEVQGQREDPLAE